MHVRSCPECGEEFRPEIVHCSDCGALLEDRYEGEAPADAAASPGAPDAPPPLAAEDFILAFSGVDSVTVRRAAARLARAGIPFRLNSAYQVLVPREQGEAAMDALGGREGAVSKSAGSEAAAAEGRCPACEAALPAEAVECPECQLVVGGEPDPD
jgi:hypothetical protein